MSEHPQGEGMLHLLLSGEESAWRDCLRSCVATDTVVLLDAGVMGLARSQLDFPCTLLALEADVCARLGTAPGTYEEVRRINDEALIRLIEEHPHCLSWR